MRKLALSLPILMSLTVTARLFGFLESAANMLEGLLGAMTPGSTSSTAVAIGGPFVVFFVGITLIAFVGLPLVAAVSGAILGGFVLRVRGEPSNPASARTYLALAFLSHVALVVFGLSTNLELLRARPSIQPATPGYILAVIAGANGAINAIVAAWILRRVSMKRPPIIMPTPALH